MSVQVVHLSQCGPQLNPSSQGVSAFDPNAVTEIGEGGMGQVYRARTPNENRCGKGKGT